MASEIAKAYVQIIPSADGISGGLSKVMGGEAAKAGESAGASMGKNLVSTLSKVIAAAGIGKLLKESLDLGGALEQNIGGAQAVFGEYADSMQAKAAEAYKNMGLSASDYMATANKMGSLFQGSGLEQQRSLELTTAAMQRAADVASVMGISQEMAMESIAGAAKGNFTMMDNLGVAMNATTLQAYALEKGVNFKWETASNAEKAELAMQMFMERTAQYAGNFAREAEDTFTGSIDSLKASWQNLMGYLSTGMDITPALQALVETAKAFLLNNLLPMIKNILSGIPVIFQELFGGINWQETLNTAMTALQEALPGAMEAITGFTDAGVNFMLQLGEGLRTGIPEFLSNILPMIEEFTGNLRENAGKLVDGGIALIKNIVQGLISAIPDLLSHVPQIIINIAGVINDNLPKILKAGLDIIIMLGKGIIENIPNIIANMGKIVEAIISVVTATNWLDLGSKIIKMFGNGIKALIQFPVDFIKSMVKSFIETIKSGGGIMSWSNVGKSIIDGIVNGLRAFGSQIKDTLMGFAREAFNAVKDFFKIGSPSRLMRDEIGKQLMAGAAVGVEKSQGIFDNALNDALTGATANIDVGQVSGNYTAASGGGSVVINVYGAKGMDENSLANIVMQKIVNQTQAVGVAFA